MREERSGQGQFGKSLHLNFVFLGRFPDKTIFFSFSFSYLNIYDTGGELASKQESLPPSDSEEALGHEGKCRLYSNGGSAVASIIIAQGRNKGLTVNSNLAGIFSYVK